MPYPMTHLHIAHKILESAGKIGDKPAFYLGSIAPDCAHFSDNFSGDLKKRTHLVNGDEKWGSITDLEGWRQDALCFLSENKDYEPRDFMYGYCAHILADILNAEIIWLPFLKDNPVDPENPWSSVLHEDASRRDMNLYRSDITPEIFGCLELSVPMGIPGVAEEKHVAAIRHNILRVQYENAPKIPDFAEQDTEDFIDIAVKRILEDLY